MRARRGAGGDEELIEPSDSDPFQESFQGCENEAISNIGVVLAAVTSVAETCITQSLFDRAYGICRSLKESGYATSIHEFYPRCTGGCHFLKESFRLITESSSKALKVMGLFRASPTERCIGGGGL